MSADRSIKRYLEREARHLEQKFEGIENCRVVFEMPYHQGYPGIYDFKVELGVPGSKIKVTRVPSSDDSGTNIFALIHNAFEELEHKLDLVAQSQKVKQANAKKFIPGDSEAL